MKQINRTLLLLASGGLLAACGADQTNHSHDGGAEHSHAESADDGSGDHGHPHDDDGGHPDEAAATEAFYGDEAESEGHAHGDDTHTHEEDEHTHADDESDEAHGHDH